MRISTSFATAITLATALGVSITASAVDTATEEVVSSATFDTTGDELQCLTLRTIRDIQYPGDDKLVFEMRGGARYLNELSGVCNGLQKERRFDANGANVGRLCKGQVITVTDQLGIVRGSCGLGEFQELVSSR
ncbi:MAG: hypothetical protein AAGA68_14125 [Pseudomonadota bacterium]